MVREGKGQAQPHQLVPVQHGSQVGVGTEMHDTVLEHDCEHATDEPMAAQMVFDLWSAYPGHCWSVTIKGGLVIIRNLEWSQSWGMNIPYSKLSGDAQDRKRQVIMAAGEFLERANMRRGAKAKDVAHIEGIPDKDIGR